MKQRSIGAASEMHLFPVSECKIRTKPHAAPQYAGFLANVMFNYKIMHLASR
jgi:hypothetical protein